MYVGVDYYPEHWPRSRWQTDARLMKRAGFNVVRLAEFAWVMLEPEEGRFEFDWLDDALGVLARHGISAILGTPTASMPAWVARKYPEVLATKDDGTRHNWGGRKNNCFSSGAYRLLSERITGAMARHFARTPNVIGWQTDNEFGHPKCFCDSCRGEFQDWLARKYGSLDELNRAWGTHFWGHRAGTWGEIGIAECNSFSNRLDYMRFLSWLQARFQRDQVRIIRRHCPRHFVTHNCMGLFKDINYYELAGDLDFVSWDNYPIWGKPSVRYGASMAADLMRGAKGRNFWIMEQTAGPCGSGRFARNARPGEIRSVAHQQVAHGADGMVWFRWRTCTAGVEQYWHGLLGHDGKPLRRYREAARTAGELHRLAPLLEGTTVKADVGIIYDYDSIWAVMYQAGFEGNDYPARAARYYDALFRAGVNADMVRPGDPIDSYKLVLAPCLHVLPDPLARRLVAYVRAGGVLLADCRTAVKDATNICHARTLPGLLAPALGIRIEEYESLTENDEYPICGTAGLPGSYTAIQYVDWLTAGAAKAMATYGQWHMEKFAAVTRNGFGSGFGWYVGAIVKEPEFYDRLVGCLLADAGIKPLVHPPPGVEASVRQGRGRKLLFLINHTEQEQTVGVPAGKIELLSGRKTGRTIGLDRHGVAVLRL